MKSFEQQTTDRITTLTAWCAVISLVLAAGIGLLVVDVLDQHSGAAALHRATVRLSQRATSVAASNHQGCKIQSRTLQAQRYLTSSLDGIHALLVLPPTKASRRQQSRLPTRERRRLTLLLHRLNANLAGYVSIERRQPAGRAC